MNYKGDDTMKEEWKDIEDFEGAYQISNLGRVKSLGGWRGTAKRKEKIRTIHSTHDGYAKVRLQHQGKDKTMRVHRLVAKAFIPNPKNMDTVNHIDGNKKNNKVSNLEWVDRTEQMIHAYKLGLKNKLYGKANGMSKAIIQYDLNYNILNEFETIQEANALLKYVKSKFCRTLLGILKITQGNNRDTWAKVPLQDFTANSDIDWSKSIPEIDKQLYEKYGLTEEEVEFIESMIKPMAE